MADFETSPDKAVQKARGNRFDRADFVARRPIDPQTSMSSLRLPAVAAPVDPSSRAASPGTDVLRPTPDDGMDSSGSDDEQATTEHLAKLGWSKASIRKILGGPERNGEISDGDTISTAQTEAYLRSLGWSLSDISRLLVGPDRAHQTAESLFRQHAANPTEAQDALLKAFSQAGAQRIKPETNLLAGLDVAHLSPESPKDLEQLITQFAALPNVQKQRFLLLLNSQKPKQKSPNSAKGSGGAADNTASSGDALPVVKSGLDLLNTALKGLLGSLGETKKNAGGRGSPAKHKPSFESASGEDGDEGEANDDWAEDSGTSSPESSSITADTSLESDSESAPD